MNSRSGGINNWNVLCGFAIDPVLYGELQSSSLVVIKKMALDACL